MYVIALSTEGFTQGTNAIGRAAINPCGFITGSDNEDFFQLLWSKD